MDISEIREQQETRRNTPALLRSAAFLAILLGVIFTCLLFYNDPGRKNDAKTNIGKTDYYELNGNIGGFVGGVAGALFSLAGFFLIYLTFTNQKDTSKGQAEQKENPPFFPTTIVKANI